MALHSNICLTECLVTVLDSNVCRLLNSYHMITVDSGCGILHKFVQQNFVITSDSLLKFAESLDCLYRSASEENSSVKS